MNLFNITAERKWLIQELEAADGEASEELLEQLAINRDTFSEKLEAYGYIMRKLETDVVSIESEIARLVALKTAKNKAYDRLKGLLLEAIQVYGDKDPKGVFRAEAGTFRFSTARNPKGVEVFDEALIPDEFKVAKTVVSVSKTTIKNALEMGQEVPGAKLKDEEYRLVVK
jgi:hypothetical protein